MKTTTTTTILIRHAEVVQASRSDRNGTARCPHCNGEIPTDPVMPFYENDAIECTENLQIVEQKLLNERREK